MTRQSSRPSRWQIRRTARRMRRFGVQPTMDIADHTGLGEYTLAAIGHGIWRYRSELAPIAYGLAVYLAAGVAHVSISEWWWICPPTGIAAGCLLYFLGTHVGLTADLERLYAFTIAITSGLWLAAATKYAPATPPLPAIIIIAGIILAVPWWAHHRRRAKVRVERKLEAWPEVAEAIGLAGSKIQSAMVDPWGWRARIQLARGQTLEDAVDKKPAIESGFDTRRGAARIQPTADNLARHVELRVIETDPHADAIAWPGPAVTSIIEPFTLGLFEDGTPVKVSFLRQHALKGGTTGSGKSGGVNVVLGNLTACRDVVVWGIDLKGGMELAPWSACLDRLATNPRQAEALLKDAVARLQARARLLTRLGLRTWEPSPDAPALVIAIDEYAELTDWAPAATAYADSIARLGRAVAVTLVSATQKPSSKAMGEKNMVRSQSEIRICFRVKEPRDVNLVLGEGSLKAGWHAHRLDAVGKFLISTPDHDVPQPARAYLIDDQAVQEASGRHATDRPTLDNSPENPEINNAETPPDAPDESADPNHGDGADNAPDAILWAVLSLAPDEGVTVPELIDETGMSRPWIYRRLRALVQQGHVTQVRMGRWRADGDLHEE